MWRLSSIVCVELLRTKAAQTYPFGNPCKRCLSCAGALGAGSSPYPGVKGYFSISRGQGGVVYIPGSSARLPRARFPPAAPQCARPIGRSKARRRSRGQCGSGFGSNMETGSTWTTEQCLKRAAGQVCRPQRRPHGVLKGTNTPCHVAATLLCGLGQTKDAV